MEPGEHEQAGCVLSALAKELLDRHCLVTLGTTSPSGWPHSTTVWAERDGDDVLVATVIRRKKEKNIRSDPRVSLAMFDPADSFRAVSIQGLASFESGGADLIQKLSHKYEGRPYTFDEGTGNVRITIRIRPIRVTGTGD